MGNWFLAPRSNLIKELMRKYFKVEVYCPQKSSTKVRDAIGDAGGGRSKNYSHCAYVSEGVGFFRPLEGATPHIGRVGKMTRVDEVKIEVPCEEEYLEAVLEAIRKTHPYEMPWIGVYEMKHSFS